jgi:hypothetical protein
MKVFAILAASLMTAGGAAYYLQDSCSTCHDTASYPVARTGGCCTANTDQPSCCSIPCCASAAECADCCLVCELCCSAAAQVPVSTQVVPEEETCCAACNSPALLAIDAATASAGVK